MSFSKFLEKPAIKEVFAESSISTKKIRALISQENRDAPLIVGSTGEYQSLVANAFAYMLHFQLARETMLDQTFKVEIFDNGWVAERALDALANSDKYRDWEERWFKIIERARILFGKYINGEVNDLEKIAVCCQYLANADMFYRVGEFNPAFKGKDSVTCELLELATGSSLKELVSPKKIYFVNPWFNDRIDCDMLVDDMIIDFKTTSEMQLSLAAIKQLAAYAVLFENLGIQHPTDNKFKGECKEIGLYFSRHQQLVRWHVGEIFNPGGFDRFSTVVLEELKTFGQLQTNDEVIKKL